MDSITCRHSYRLATVVVVFLVGRILSGGPAKAQDRKPEAAPGQSVLVQTVQLSEPLEKARKLLLYGSLGGEGTLVLDPNRCTINLFGDDEVCTEVAPIYREVKLLAVKTADPLNKGRTLYEVVGAGLIGGHLFLVVPPDPNAEAFRFVYETRGSRRVITGERLVYRANLLGPGGIPIIDIVKSQERCEAIDFKAAEVEGGFVNNTYFLVVSGEKPYINMKVRLRPRVYVRQPDYWEIDVVGCVEGEIKLPRTGPYVTDPLSLEGVRGKKGIKVVGKTTQKELDVPPRSKREEK